MTNQTAVHAILVCIIEVGHVCTLSAVKLRKVQTFKEFVQLNLFHCAALPELS